MCEMNIRLCHVACRFTFPRAEFQLRSWGANARPLLAQFLCFLSCRSRQLKATWEFIWPSYCAPRVLRVRAFAIDDEQKFIYFLNKVQRNASGS